MKRIFLSLCEIFLLLCSLIFTCDVHVTYRGFTLVWIFPKNRIFLLSHHFKTTQGLQPDNFSQKTQNINSLSVYPNVFWCSGKVYLASNDLISHIRTTLKHPFKKSQFFASWYFTKIHKNWNIENVKMQTVDFFKMDVLKPFWYDN